MWIRFLNFMKNDAQHHIGVFGALGIIIAELIFGADTSLELMSFVLLLLGVNGAIQQGKRVTDYTALRIKNKVAEPENVFNIPNHDYEDITDEGKK